MDPTVGSAADKKRNKLGYHRSSVACVHCRRRKIRCLLASDDIQGRCENCIRLKKECHFFPVDQQPLMEMKLSHAGSKTGAISTETSMTSSPPLLGSGGMVDQKDSYFQYAPLPLNSGQDISQFEPSPFVETLMSKFSPDPLSATDLSTVPSANLPVSWEGASYFDHQVLGAATKSQMATPGNPAWSQASPGAPLSTASSIPGTPITPGILPSTGDPTAFGMQDSSVWAVAPSRSMSLASRNLTQYQGQYQQSLLPEFKRRMTSPGDGYAHPINSSMPELPSSAMPVSYTQTQSPEGYSTWETFQGEPTVPPTTNQPTTETTPDGLGEWYADSPQQ
ncbi:hypothetical protein PABG_04267 [Paracoccidioides brasiliensis Pb03]|nr:hypothetical protein PABG_04267 [Paracoccidioides brasiliensis Pb03]